MHTKIKKHKKKPIVYEKGIEKVPYLDVFSMGEKLYKYVDPKLRYVCPGFLPCNYPIWCHYSETGAVAETSVTELTGMCVRDAADIMEAMPDIFQSKRMVVLGGPGSVSQVCDVITSVHSNIGIFITEGTEHSRDVRYPYITYRKNMYYDYIVVKHRMYGELAIINKKISVTDKWWIHVLDESGIIHPDILSCVNEFL